MILVYLCKMMISPAVFSFFLIFSFFGLLGVKGQKMVAQDEKYSVCHAPYLRNHTSYDFHLWYLDVSISSFFHFFNILIFRVVLGGGKGAKKIAQNDKKFCLLHAIFQEPYIISLSFVVHKCKIITSLVISFVFSKF